MNFNSTIDSVLDEEYDTKQDFLKYKLYIDLNDLFLKTIIHNTVLDNGKKAGENIDTVNYIIHNFHKDIYQDLSVHDVEKVKELFKKDFIDKKKTTEIALAGFDKFENHLHNGDKQDAKL